MTENRTATGWAMGAATVAMGLIAGVFYVFACAVMPALARSDDRVFVEVMRNINDVIQNPVFLLAFMGALVLTAVSAWQVRGRPYRGWVWAGLVAYALAFLVTVAFNIPLNDELARTADVGVARERFESAWVGWNVVRAVLSTVGVGCLARALVLYGAFERRVAAQHRPSKSSPSGV
ncbi:anthrone oxygenase family protein [Streptomyces sp. W16]|uniref:anthrone oxygenase family protein n=1 Tax=Streptomyces sp. W16 TaxID=3076631 RepID=UPI00295B4B0E|nr:anthrone oxygenase family protein [Streptomyces sp. W16]MDV9173473.1 anthrone oxygenase family protein [Streptomyces sp. W16]